MYKKQIGNHLTYQYVHDRLILSNDSLSKLDQKNSREHAAHKKQKKTEALAGEEVLPALPQYNDYYFLMFIINVLLWFIIKYVNVE